MIKKHISALLIFVILLLGLILLGTVETAFAMFDSIVTSVPTAEKKKLGDSYSDSYMPIIDTTRETTLITFPGNSGPIDTGVEVHPGEMIRIIATGMIFNGVVETTPDGFLNPPNPAHGVTILPNISSNSLVGSIGDFETGTLLDDGFDYNPSGISGTEVGYPGLFGPGYVGSSFGMIASVEGNIYLAMNDTPLYDNTGSFEVQITILSEFSFIPLIFK